MIVSCLCQDSCPKNMITMIKKWDNIVTVLELLIISHHLLHQMDLKTFCKSTFLSQYGHFRTQKLQNSD